MYFKFEFKRQRQPLIHYKCIRTSSVHIMNNFDFRFKKEEEENYSFEFKG